MSDTYNSRGARAENYRHIERSTATRADNSTKDNWNIWGHQRHGRDAINRRDVNYSRVTTAGTLTKEESSTKQGCQKHWRYHTV
jgi:hypothetical protein